MLSPYRTPPETHKIKQKILNREHDLVTSNDLKRLQMTSKESSALSETIKHNISKKNNLKSVVIFEINYKNLYEILHINNL